MRYRFTFLAGFAVGFITGARAGRERYEQIKAAARKAADSPAMQQAAGAAQAQASNLARSARDKAAQRMPKIAEKAKSTLPGMRARDANGHPQPGSTYSSASGTSGTSGEPAG